MANTKRTLPFAKEFGWTDQKEIGDADSEGIVNLHNRNQIEIPLCECRRCMKFKLQKKVEEREAEMERVLRPEERVELNNQVIEETDSARNRARLKGLYV